MVEGERILGRFTIGERIGSGGHGAVHRAWDERLCRHVAVKSVAGVPPDRVLREAHAAARLNHPGIVTLYELGQESGQAYLVSELVRGANLRDLAADARISDRDVAELGAEVCAALAHAHSQGVVHRDIKPDNVLVRDIASRRARTDGERAKLVDFGIATVVDEQPLTAPGEVAGTLAYMAPEQAAGEGCDHRSDVYALGLTLFELWSGRNPVAAATPAATVRRIGAEQPSLLELRPELPPDLAVLIDACLAVDPEARPGLSELADGLHSVAGALHPDRAVPEPLLGAQDPAGRPEPEPASPFAVGLAAAAVAFPAVLAGLQLPALVMLLLGVPALLLLGRPLDWIRPAIAPLLGFAAIAPVYLVTIAEEPPRRRIVLAALGWLWVAAIGAAVGEPLGSTAAGAATGPGDLLVTLLSSEAIATLLVWVGAALLLGALADVAAPASILVGGLVWAAIVVASLAAVGGSVAPSPILAPALLVAVAILSWDRAGRPLPGSPVLTGLLPRRSPVAGPRSRAGVPAERAALDDPEAQAGRRAVRHVAAALHGAGSRGGLP